MSLEERQRGVIVIPAVGTAYPQPNGTHVFVFTPQFNVPSSDSAGSRPILPGPEYLFQRSTGAGEANSMQSIVQNPSGWQQQQRFTPNEALPFVYGSNYWLPFQRVDQYRESSCGSVFFTLH